MGTVGSVSGVVVTLQLEGADYSFQNPAGIIGCNNCHILKRTASIIKAHHKSKSETRLKMCYQLFLFFLRNISAWQHLDAFPTT